MIRTSHQHADGSVGSANVDQRLVPSGDPRPLPITSDSRAPAAPVAQLESQEKKHVELLVDHLNESHVFYQLI